jgi:hypothetical protein
MKQYFSFFVSLYNYNQNQNQMKVYEITGGFVFNRTIPTLKTIKKKDYIKGFGLDTSHYAKVKEARKKHNLENSSPLPLREEFKEVYDVRTGFYIDGTEIPTKHHPYHDCHLINKKGEKYIIETVVKCHYLGYYIQLVVRKDGTKSHATIIWENINSHCPIIKESVKENEWKMLPNKE